MGETLFLLRVVSRSTAMEKASSGQCGPNPPAGRQEMSAGPRSDCPHLSKLERDRSGMPKESPNQRCRVEVSGTWSSVEENDEAKRERMTVIAVCLAGSTEGHTKPACLLPHRADIKAYQLGTGGGVVNNPCLTYTSYPDPWWPRI
jgi:hypothetical protein